MGSDKNKSDLWKSDQMKKIYHRENYKVIDLENESNICLVCFSSNGLYYPNTVKEFEKQIIIRDIYEWENICCSNMVMDYAKRIIFVRDIFKQWYVSGINENYNSIDKVYELLLQLTKGYQVVTLGGSSGGYAAVIFGIRLNAVKVYSFSGQFTIMDEVEDYFFLKRYKNNEVYAQYYELDKLLKNNKSVPIYYFYPANCMQDVQQFNYIKHDENIYSFAFKYSTHATTMYRCNFPYIVIKSNEELYQLFQKCKGSVFTKKKFLFVSTDWLSFWYELKKNKEVKLLTQG